MAIEKDHIKLLRHMQLVNGADQFLLGAAKAAIFHAARHVDDEDHGLRCPPGPEEPNPRFRARLTPQTACTQAPFAREFSDGNIHTNTGSEGGRDWSLIQHWPHCRRTAFAQEFRQIDRWREGFRGRSRVLNARLD